MAAKKKRPRGRPKLPKGQDRGRLLTVRLRPDEHAKLERAAKASGKLLSRWVRDALMEASNVS